jgi:hypothetical protein
MKIHVGYDLIYDCVAPPPMVFMLNVHPSRAADLLTSDRMRVTPARTITAYADGFGNKCVRLLGGVESVRQDAARLGARAGDLRLRPQTATRGVCIKRSVWQ